MVILQILQSLTLLSLTVALILGGIAGAQAQAARSPNRFPQEDERRGAGTHVVSAQEQPPNPHEPAPISGHRGLTE